MWPAAFIALLGGAAAAPVGPISTSDFLPVGSGATVTFDDACTSTVAGSVAYSYFGTTAMRTFSVSSNGLFSLGAACSTDFSPNTLPDDKGEVIAVYWEDLSPNAGGSVTLRVSSDSADLAAFSALFDATSVSFTPTEVVVATWLGVPYFSTSIFNSFQFLLATDGTSTYSISLYADIGFDTGETPVAGFVSDDGQAIFPYGVTPLTSEVMDIEEGTNVGITGMFVFDTSAFPLTELVPGLVGDPILVDFAGHRFMAGARRSTEYLLYRSQDESEAITMTTGTKKGMEGGYFAVAMSVERAGCGSLHIAVVGTQDHVAEVSGDPCMMSRVARGDEGLVLLPVGEGGADGSVLAVFPHKRGPSAAFLNSRLLQTTPAFRAGCTGMLCNEAHGDIEV